MDEILSHLLGRAKNIVKVGLKSNSDKIAHPEIIYDILRRYFGDTSLSSLPLADFYATQLDPDESPVDYWVRLNIAAEHADRHLRKSGGKMENMSVEVAMKFIWNCPNSDLSCSSVSRLADGQLWKSKRPSMSTRGSTRQGGPLERRGLWWQQQLQLLAARRQGSRLQ